MNLRIYNTLSRLESSGMVAGEDWAAHSIEALAAGTKIRVVGADGIVLEVTHT